MGSNRQQGITLIELMVAVAIVGVLASLAVFMFGKQTRKAKASEVGAIFAEIKVRQEHHHLEQNSYATTTLSTDASLGDYLPAGQPGSERRVLLLDPYPEEHPWRQLRFSPDRQALYCGYVSVAGGGGTLPTEAGLAVGAPFNLCTPPCTGAEIPGTDDYFYVLAQCDFDGDGVNSTYFAASFASGMTAHQDGE